MIICFSHVLSTKSERLDLSHRLKSSVVDTTHAAVMPPSLDATPYSSSSSSGRSMISYGNVRRAKVRPKPREIKHRRSTVEQEILVRTSQDVSAKQHHEPYGKSKRWKKQKCCRATRRITHVRQLLRYISWRLLDEFKALLCEQGPSGVERTHWLRCYVKDCFPKTEKYELNIKINLSRTFPMGYTGTKQQKNVWYVFPSVSIDYACLFNDSIQFVNSGEKKGIYWNRYCCRKSSE